LLVQQPAVGAQGRQRHRERVAAGRRGERWQFAAHQ